MTGESMRFDGRAELDGTFRILAGKGDDILTGGAQADFFYGNFGKDVLEGRGGADTFLYRAAGESAGPAFDQLVGFDHRVDRIDLPVTTAFVGYTAATVREASFDADLAAALQTLGAGQARIVNVQAGDMVGRMFAVADGNGAAGYQAGQDFVIELLSPPVMPAAGDPFFI
jgi:Ca2+-binding RTX toxin-like protein